jgi:hypothetical protein
MKRRTVNEISPALSQAVPQDAAQGGLCIVGQWISDHSTEDEMIRERKLQIRSDNGTSAGVYVEFEDRFNEKPKIVRVMMAGDLLDITDRISDRERMLIQRQLEITK